MMRLAKGTLLGELFQSHYSHPALEHRLTIVASGLGVRALLFASDASEPSLQGIQLIPSKAHPIMDRLSAQLDHYFDGLTQTFSIELDLVGSPFQREVWQSLQNIPYGKTESYQQQATRLGCPGAVRAVASANAANPVSLILPCHRVIRKNGELGGYAGGLSLKQWLLRHEQAI